MAVAATYSSIKSRRLVGLSDHRNSGSEIWGRTAGPVHPEAMAHYKQTLDMEPDTARAHINLGNTLRAGGKLEEATAHYLKALDIEPRNAGAHINLGNILRVGGRFDEAEAHYLKALEIEP